MKIVLKSLLPVLLLILWQSPGLAQEPDFPLYAAISIEELYGDEEMVSIATGSSKPIYIAPAVASVITAKQIEAMGARTLDEVLETVPGLHVSLSKTNRLNSVYSIRGIHTSESPQLLMLMNGLPFPYLFSGSRPQNFQLPVTAIARIEVLRGPGSAVYGADAFSGVVNIITKTVGDIDGTTAGTRYGSFNSRDFWLQHGNQLGDIDAIFTLEWQKSDGDRDRIVNSDLQSLFDPSVSNAPGPLDTRYDVLDMHLDLQWGDWTLSNWYWLQDNMGVGAGGAQALDPAGYDNSKSLLVNLGWKNNDLVQNWNFSADLNYHYMKSRTHFVLLPEGTTVPIGTDGNLLSYAPYTVTNFPNGVIGNPGTTDHATGLDLAATKTDIPDHRLRIGVGVRHQKLEASETKNFGPGITIGTLTDVTDTPYVFVENRNRTLWYLSLQDEWDLADDWELTGGVRYDHYSDFGSTINPRLALVWATRYNLTSKLLYGRAFRAPSFSVLYSQNNPAGVGNPDLDPETIDTLELAFDYRPTFAIQTNLSIFTYQAKKLIDYLPDANGVTKTAQNANDQNGYGFELEANWKQSNKLNLSASYAWQHSEDADTGHRVADAPGQQLTLAADWKFLPDWLLHPQLNWVADRHREFGDTRPKIDDYVLVDLSLRRTDLWGHFELTLVARNLFDEDAREPSRSVIPDDFPLEGRSLWAGLSCKF